MNSKIPLRVLFCPLAGVVLIAISVFAALSGQTIVSVLSPHSVIVRSLIGIGTAFILGAVTLLWLGPRMGVTEISQLRGWITTYLRRTR